MSDSLARSTSSLAAGQHRAMKREPEPQKRCGVCGCDVDGRHTIEVNGPDRSLKIFLCSRGWEGLDSSIRAGASAALSRINDAAAAAHAAPRRRSASRP